MMIVADTSAFVSILLKEEDAQIYYDALFRSEKVLISAATAVELHIVTMARLGAEGILKMNHMLEYDFFEIVSVDPSQVTHAQRAFDRFGKGRGNSAKLNYGDLFSYALAKDRNLPLLFKGDDFSETDIVPALSLLNEY